MGGGLGGDGGGVSRCRSRCRPSPAQGSAACGSVPAPAGRAACAGLLPAPPAAAAGLPASDGHRGTPGPARCGHHAQHPGPGHGTEGTEGTEGTVWAGGSVHQGREGAWVWGVQEGSAIQGRARCEHGFGMCKKGPCIRGVQDVTTVLACARDHALGVCKKGPSFLGMQEGTAILGCADRDHALGVCKKGP